VKKKTILTLVKLSVSLAVLGYLLYNVRTSYAETIDQLINQPKDWWKLAGAWVLIFASVLLTFVRWYWLVRALDLPFRLRDGLRLGFLGFMFNFVSLGSVGGDLFKAVFLAHEHPGRRAEAISTIIVDRLIGLYGLLLLGAVVVLSGGLKDAGADVHQLKFVTLIGTGVITLLCGVMMWPGLLHGKMSDYLCGLPKVGPHVNNLLRAARTYRSRHGVLWGSLAITMVIHMLNVAGFYYIAHGLPGDAPGWADHMLIIPLAVLASAIPVSLAGLGVFEVVMQKLYALVAPAGMIPNLGMIVALIDRVIMLLIAVVGVFFYIGGRREVREVMHEVDEAGEEDTAVNSTANIPR
jgi:uncharacterized membrane protein YbhN (UPF0104 family)